MSLKIFISSITSIVIALLLIYLNPSSVITIKIKNIAPDSVKQIIRQTIFFIPDTKNYIFTIDKKNKEYEMEIRKLSNSISEQTIMGAISSKKNITVSKSSIILDEGLKLSSYKLPLTHYMHNDKAVAYIDQSNETLFIISGNGHSFSIKKNSLGNEKIMLVPLLNNLQEIINDKLFFDTIKFDNKDSNVVSIKDLLVLEDNLLISFTKELSSNCYNTSILKASIEKKELIFEDFFVPTSCVVASSLEDVIMSGGRMEPYLKDTILFTIGDYRQWPEAQNLNSILGKILKLNIKDSAYKIFSLGHRNPQGLMFDKDSMNIFSTEHGPRGGDEINIIKKDKNYGWPLASYGDMYLDMNYTKEEKISAPMTKSHKNYSAHEINGFEEPLFTASRYRDDYKKIFNVGFDQSSGLSEIEKIPSESAFSALGDIVVTSMQQKNIYFFTLSEDQQRVINGKKIAFPDRVRDITYIQNIDAFALVLEHNPSLAILEIQP
jgi:hypothetical protein